MWLVTMHVSALNYIQLKMSRNLENKDKKSVKIFSPASTLCHKAIASYSFVDYLNPQHSRQVEFYIHVILYLAKCNACSLKLGSLYTSRMPAGS